MGRFTRNVGYRSKHNKRCQELKETILKTAADYRRVCELGRNKKHLLNYMIRQYGRNKVAADLHTIKVLRITLAKLARESKLYELQLIELKAQYHSAYQKLFKVVEHA
ncbi:hypothetical protein JOAD_184 [Erwinia phage vB_EamM_Joad]|uniref:Uncharacterized protein n=1 Tax=Erwinia phage vB_EamM_Joad TaxID=2026081 RepID=A0A223LI80_9CAUD|nr:hypothetical protein JOAD_184 [Erwinia phage vB_EamM_Joad]